MKKNKNDIVNQLCILIVEDNEINFLLLKEILSELNAIVLQAKTGLEAIKIYQNNTQINLVLMDIKLPDISGLEVTKQLKSIRDNVPIIAQTAYALGGDKKKVLDAGCTDYISKPILSAELIMKVKQHILKDSS